MKIEISIYVYKYIYIYLHIDTILYSKFWGFICIVFLMVDIDPRSLWMPGKHTLLLDCIQSIPPAEWQIKDQHTKVIYVYFK